MEEEEKKVGEGKRLDREGKINKKVIKREDIEGRREGEK